MGKHKEKSKKHKHEKNRKEKKKKRKSSSSSSGSEWVEKDEVVKKNEEATTSKRDEEDTNSKRDEWMSLGTSFSSESHLDRRKEREETKKLEREREKYNPREHTRELNPYWKDGGDGLPKFKKPTDDGYEKKYESTNRSTSSSWRKKTTNDAKEERLPVESKNGNSEALTDKELNILASKLVKAEIMGKTLLVAELKEKLERARNQKKEEHVILTQTDSQGHSRPVKLQNEYGESSRKKRKVETHQDGQRMRYFADDDKHSLQQMFENEKYNTTEDQNKEFLQMANRVRKNDDLDDIFTDNIRKDKSDQSDKKQIDRAITQYERVTKTIETCRRCIQSSAMLKHLMVSLGETVFLSLPAHEPLTDGHCLISTISHTTCSVLLDENEWAEITNIRRGITRMFNSKKQDVIFFEVAKNLERYPHMCIECIPLDQEQGDMAPIYFKKAIDECEVEWAQNKKLVSLKGRDVRRAVPKGLPYFFVSFGMEEGFAHVIEDENKFPSNFAQEIIGGMLDLHHSKWRKPKQQSFEEQSRRVVEFSKEWSSFEKT